MESTLIKIGGEIIDQPGRLEKLVDWLINQLNKGQSVILVHGAGKQVDRLCHQMNIPIKKFEGRRITDAEALEATVQIIGGSVNKHLVSELNKAGMNAVGLTAADGMVTISERRKPWLVDDQSIDFGFVGEIQEVNPKLLNVLTENGYVPVIGCLTWSPTDGLLNINADTLATELAVTLHCDDLILMTETGSVWDQNGQVLPSIQLKQFENGKKDGWIKEGMIPKLQNGFSALYRGVKNVHICSPETISDGGTSLIHES